MKAVHVYLMNSLVDGGRGGNPAGVVLDADDLSLAQMQTLATRVGVSETAFLSKSKLATYKLDFFTPLRQIPHCGHATIAAFCLLFQQGTLANGIYSKETIDGLRTIEIEDGTAFMQQNPPRFLAPGEHGVSNAEVAASISIDIPVMWETYPPLAIHTGNRFLVIPLPDQKTLAALLPVLPEIERISESLDCIGFYPFTLETIHPNRVAATRMFAPRFGIPEESATGTAAGPLAGYLVERMHIPNETFDIEQGLAMPVPSPSLLHVKVDRDIDRIERILVGGKAVIQSEINLEL